MAASRLAIPILSLLILGACSGDDSGSPKTEMQDDPAAGDDGGDGDGDADGSDDPGGDGDGDGDGDADGTSDDSDDDGDLPPDPDPDDVPVGDGTITLDEGEPVTAPANTWTWVPVEGTFCQNGSATGFGIQINPTSDKLIIYLEGGGACFSGNTCFTTLTAYGSGNFGSGPNNAILADEAPNPFADYSKVYIPYCTGDTHTGTTMDGFQNRPQRGYVNFTLDLQRIVPTFKSKVSSVVLTGASAGAFGAAWNWMRTQDAFGTIPVHLLDDSAPPFGPQFLSPCLQQHNAAGWGWADAIHPACVSCDAEAGKVVRPMMDTALKRRMSGTRFGLLSNDEDGTMKSFFAYGLEDCDNLNAFLPPIYPSGKFPEGLDELRAHIGGLDDVGIFEIRGGSHVLLSSSGAWTNTKVGDVPLVDWVTWFRDGDAQWGNLQP